MRPGAAERAVDLLRRAIASPSVTGSEAAFVAMLASELRTLGLEPNVEDFLPGRPNVWAHLPGGGDGPCLLLLGHTDTVHARGWAEQWAGTERESPFAGPLLDGEIWGRGAADLKAGICTVIEAMRVLRESATPLAGSVVLAFVGDEESGEPGTGISAGMRALVAAIGGGRVPKPDFAVYVEPTQLAIYPAQMGFFTCEITLVGRSAYFGVPERGVDALRAAHGVLAALWAHSARLEADAAHPLIGRSFVLVTGITAGGLIAVPGACRIDLIRKLRPGEDLSAAAAAIENAVRAAITHPGIAVAFAYPAGRDHRLGGLPYEVDAGHPAIAQLAACLARSHPGGGGIEGAPFWSEASFLAQGLGIPAVYCAPGDIRICHTNEERVPVRDYLAGIEAFADFIAAYCGTNQGRTPP